MILRCKECDTSFNFDERLIQESGSKVRCSKCQSVFTVYPDTVAGASDESSNAEVLPEDAVTDITGAATLEDLDLDAIEKSLDFDEEGEPAEVSADTGLEIPELDFELDTPDDDSPIAAPDVEFDETQELDLADVDLQEPSTSEKPGTDEDDSLDFDLDLDMEGEETPESAGAEADDLDFSFDTDHEESDGGIEADLEIEPESNELADSADAVAGLSEETDELEFDLDFDSGQEEALADVDDEATDELDFDLDLDSESDDEGIDGLDLALDDTDELDLADLEDMMDEDGGPEGDEVIAESEDDLNFDLDLTDEEDQGDTMASDVELEKTDELDLEDLEDALDSEKEIAAATFDQTEELDLDFDLEDDEGKEETVTSEPAADDADEDFDFTDLDDLMEMEGEAEDGVAIEDSTLAMPIPDEPGDDQELATTVDYQPEIEIEDAETDLSSPESEGDQKEKLEEAFDMGDLPEIDEALDTVDEEDMLEAEAEAFSDEGGAAVATKKNSGKLVRALVVLVILVGGGFGAVALGPYVGIDLKDQLRGIPYVGEYFGPKADATGNLKITVLEKKLKGYFVLNPKLDTLYVVQGSVKNDYNHSRGAISIKGKLYSKGGKLRQTKTVFAGNMLSQKQLKSFGQKSIDKWLKTRAGQKRSNVNVQKGKQIPFMIVFTKVPDNLEEYSIEVAGSMEAKQ
jgi:predicted Zn finger-like uncharacterized protein